MRRKNVKQIERKEELDVLKSGDFYRLIAYLRTRQFLRRCVVCGQEFLSTRKNGRYCSNSCQSKASRMRARIEFLLKQS